MQDLPKVYWKIQILLLYKNSAFWKPLFKVIQVNVFSKGRVNETPLF